MLVGCGVAAFGGVRHWMVNTVGTVFQLSNPDAIYSRDKGKERRLLPSLNVCVRARSAHCQGKVRDRTEGSN
jgi:hypothetical protein